MMDAIDNGLSSPGILVHEWIEQSGGAERVLDQFALMNPGSELHVPWSDAPGRYPTLSIKESWMSRTPLRSNKAAALPFMLGTWRNLIAEHDADWILASSHLFAHHANFKNLPVGIEKFAYVHTPARYIWEPEVDTRGTGLVAKAVAPLLKRIDRKRASESSRIAANSTFTKERIRRTWGTDADVIYPPVDVDRIQSIEDWSTQLDASEIVLLESLPREFLLGASRFVPYKRLELVLEAASAIGLPVVIAGRGPEESALRTKAFHLGIDATFVISPSDAMLFALYQRTSAFVFPAIEDFGIMPVEAMAAGARVMAPEQGGAAESVNLSKGGVAMQSFGETDWRHSFRALEEIDAAGLPARAAHFGAKRFRTQITEWMGS